MSRDRDSGTNVVVMRFIMSGHDGTTPLVRIGCAIVSIALLAGCAGELSILDPAGPAASRMAEVWWVMLAGAVVILTGVMALALYAFRPARRRSPSPRLFLIGGGMVFPVATLAALLVFALMRGEQLSARADDDKLVIGAHAQQWVWTFTYPDGQETYDVLHVPTGALFQLQITSGDVIHSFWVPRLGGKMDAIPGKTNLLALKADRQGVYRGVCSEFCGIGHTEMRFELHAHPPGDYPEVLAQAVSGVDVDIVTPRAPPVSDQIDGFFRRLFARGEEE